MFNQVCTFIIFLKNSLPVHMQYAYSGQLSIPDTRVQKFNVEWIDNFEKISLNTMQRPFYQYFFSSHSILTRSLILCFIQLFDQFLKTSLFTHEIRRYLPNLSTYTFYLGKRRSFVFWEKLNFIKSDPSSLYHVPK